MTNFLWRFANPNNLPVTMPDWVVPSMYTGKFVSDTYETSANPANKTIARSDKVTMDFIVALCRAAMIDNGCDKDAYGLNSEFSIAEMTINNTYDGQTVGVGSKACVAYELKTGVFKASLNNQPYDNITTTAPFFLALWNYFLTDQNFASKYAEFCSAVEDEQKQAAACYLSGIAQDLTNSTASGGSLKIAASSITEVGELTRTQKENPKYKPLQYKGLIEEFPCTNRAKAKKDAKKGKNMTVAEFTDSFKFSDNPLTPEQEERVPKLAQGYVVHKTLVSICKHIKKTTGRPRPIRNILLRGEPGTGKSETYVGIAAGCHLPLYTFAANAMTEPYDLFGQFVPVDSNGEQTGPKMSLGEVLSDMPTAEDISMDPVIAYSRITGEYKEDATTTDCMAAAFTHAQRHIDAEGGQQKFKFVPGQLIDALKYGGVWGLDEVTLPQNPGVIPALNPAMDNTQSITLPTGEIIHRHPDCIFVGTTNIDLEGCRRMNQAWQDRCQLIIDMEEPNDNELKERVIAMTGYDETTDAGIVDLDKFIRIYHEFKQIAKRKRLDDGTIGPRKLADWVTSTLVTEDPIESAMITIIPGATADPDGIAEMREKLDQLF